MLNKWCGCGRLTKDVDYKAGDTAIGKFTLAIDRKYSKSDDKQTDFISCVCFGKTADFAQKYLSKGTKVIVVGRIQTGSYEKDGRKVYTTDVIIEDIEFAENKHTESDSTSSKPADDNFMQFDGSSADLPF